MEFIIIAGVNGSGKTTASRNENFKKLFEGVDFVNADDIALGYLKEQGFSSYADAPQSALAETFVRAANYSLEIIKSRIESKLPVGVETVLSTDKFKPVLMKAKSNGMRCTLFYVGLSSIQLSIDRISTRVRSGGHDVPVNKIQSRWEKSLENLTWFASRVDRLFVIDNSYLLERDNLIAVGEGGVVEIIKPDRLPHVTRALRLVSLQTLESAIASMAALHDSTLSETSER